MPSTVNIDIFLKEFSEKKPVILDVRSPGEYKHAHLPGSVSFPLLNDTERAEVGITYKNNGREAAVIKGFELVGPKFADFIKQAKEIAPVKEILMYCWRGGMRSNIMAWLLSLSGFNVILLKGGYKSFRRWGIEQLQTLKTILVIGGKTGSGKTELLNEIGKRNEQFVDLEKLANHKGSAFGSLGQPEQPSTEHFENLLALEWSKISPEKIVWIENESRLIGTCALPDSIFDQLRSAPVVEINLNDTIRKKRILNEYGQFDTESLKEKTKKVKKRLGGLRLKEALAYLDSGDIDNWCSIMMEYYDATYEYSNRQRNKNNLHSFFLEHDIMTVNAEKVIEFARQLTNKNLSEGLHSEKIEI